MKLFSSQIHRAFTGQIKVDKGSTDKFLLPVPVLNG